jgi:hypothetical protein
MNYQSTDHARIQTLPAVAEKYLLPDPAGVGMLSEYLSPEGMAGQGAF